jgi:hypothetical protein
MPARSGFWRKCRIGFRWCRITVLFTVLALVCALVWFNRLGLPDFLKRRLVDTLQRQGIELAFTRMRLHLVHGLVIENVRIGHAQAPDDPALSLAEVQLQLDYRALLRRQWQIDGLVLRGGRLVWSLTPTNALTLDNISTDLRFQANNTWSLDQFQADFAGAKLTLSGDVVHAPEMRNWEVFRGGKTADRAIWLARLRQLSDALDRIHFSGAPQLSLVVDGDAREIRSFIVRLNLNAASAQTPWGGAHDIRFTASLTAPMEMPTNVDHSLAWWTNALPYRLVWTAQVARLKSEMLNADTVVCSGLWRAPELTVTRLSAGLGGGRLDATARLNVATREFAFTNSSDFDVHAIAALLTEKTRDRLAEFSWAQPPSIQASGSLVMPAWTNQQPDWRAEVQPTLQLNGELNLENATVLGAKVDWVHTHFFYSNLVWQLPDLAVVKAKTRLALSGGEDDRTQIYRWYIRGRFDPEAIRPFLTASNALRGLDHFSFSEPLALEMDLGGRLYAYDSISVTGRVALTNFTLRGQSVDNLTSELSYTNRILEFLHPHLWHGTQTMTADKVTMDFNARLIVFTNGFSTADPRMVTHAIGPKTGRLMDPYLFLEPPTAQVNGCLPLRDMNGPRDTEGTDMRFDIVNSVPFQWMRLKSPGITGTIHWLGSVLILTNIQAALYGGAGSGRAYFDFRAPHEGADYDFSLTVSNVDLHALAVDLSSPTNRLEGTLAGWLAVTHADSRDWHTWDGYGHAYLHDGLLWDIPIFGFLSPVLNTFSSGLGNSRATDGAAGFSMTNGVIYSNSLEIRSAMMRLEYVGTVDLRQNVNARVTAELLRNTWMIGPVVSTVLWPVSKLFEYRVTGTLKNPKSEPVYVPKLLLFPLHPIRTLEEILSGGESDSNRPPENSNGQ